MLLGDPKRRCSVGAGRRSDVLSVNEADLQEPQPPRGEAAFLRTDSARFTRFMVRVK